MSFISKHSRVVTVGACCAAIGAGGSAIATAGASTPQHHPARSAASANARAHGGRWGLLARRAVHGDIVVHTRHGFATITLDRGVVKSVTGGSLTLTEGTPKATYKTVTLTIPSTARVRDNHQKATMSSITPGQRVIVAKLPRRTVVIAHTPRG